MQAFSIFRRVHKVFVSTGKCFFFPKASDTPGNFYMPIAANLIASENRKRFSPPIDADTPGDFFRRSARRRGTLTLFPGSTEGRFEKS